MPAHAGDLPHASTRKREGGEGSKFRGEGQLKDAVEKGCF